jgi:hypothetical protein
MCLRYFQYLLLHFVCANIFGAIVFNLRFKIDGTAHLSTLKSKQYIS